MSVKLSPYEQPPPGLSRTGELPKPLRHRMEWSESWVAKDIRATPQGITDSITVRDLEDPMKRDIGSLVIGAAAVLISFYIASAPVYAQIGEVSKPGFGKAVNEPPPMPKPGPTPRTRDGHPDLSGVWFIGTSGTVDLTAATSPSQRRFDPKVTPQEPPSFQPWVAL